MANQDSRQSPQIPKQRSAHKSDCIFFSPKFKSAAAMAGWDKEALHLAFDDTPRDATIVYGKAVADGDTITVYVSTMDPRESSSVPSEVQMAVVHRSVARLSKNYPRADELHQQIIKLGYRVLSINNQGIFAKNEGAKRQCCTDSKQQRHNRRLWLFDDGIASPRDHYCRSSGFCHGFLRRLIGGGGSRELVSEIEEEKIKIHSVHSL